MKRFRIGTIIIVLLLSLLLIGCGDRRSPSEAVQDDLGSLKTLSSEELFEATGIDIVQLSELNEEDYKPLIAKILTFEYNVGEETIDGDTAEVTVVIRTYPFGEVLTEKFPDLVYMAFTNKSTEELFNMADTGVAVTEITPDQLADLMIDPMMKLTEKTYDKVITIHCTKTDDGWTTDINKDNKELYNAILGGMPEAVDLIKHY